MLTWQELLLRHLATLPLSSFLIKIEEKRKIYYNMIHKEENLSGEGRGGRAAAAGRRTPAPDCSSHPTHLHQTLPRSQFERINKHWSLASLNMTENFFTAKIVCALGRYSV